MKVCEDGEVLVQGQPRDVRTTLRWSGSCGERRLMSRRVC